MSFRHTSLAHMSLVAGLAAALAVGMASDGFARAGSGGSFGSRGSSTFSAPPSTSISPRGGSTIERSMTPSQGSPNAGIFRPNAAPAAGGFFGGGFGRGLLGGFLGAGVFGLLFGHGMFGGLGGGVSIIGLLIQLGLLFLVVKFAISFFRNRNAGFAGAGFNAPGQFNAPNQPQGSSNGGFGMPYQGSGFGGGNAAQRDKLQIQPDDFNAFEDKLAQVQAAYGREDYAAIRQNVTPEMASYFSEQLAENAQKGVQNKLGVPKLLAGDLAEAWSEQGSDYATVAMRFAMADWMVERATGKIVSGDPNVPQEAAEVWTFVRPRGGAPADWKLSAIQQA